MDNTEVDLIQLAKLIWLKRVLLLRFSIFGLGLGLFLSIVSATEYTSYTTLLPEANSENESGAAGLLQKYGGLLGISNGDSYSSAGAVRVDLYPKIVESLSFQMQLMNRRLYFQQYDTVVSIFDYYDKIRPLPFSEGFKKYTIGLPGVIRSKLNPSKDASSTPNYDDEVVRVSMREMRVIEKLRNLVTCSIDIETGIIKVEAVLPEAECSARLAKIAVDILTEYITNYRLEKANENLYFVENQMKNAKDRFEKAQVNLAMYLDENHGNRTAKSKLSEDRFRSEFDLAFNVYQSLAQQHEQAKLTVQKERPIFKVLQPVTVPTERSKPKRALMLAFSIFASILVGTAYVFVVSGLQRNSTT